jgi:hypothetical protein
MQTTPDQAASYTSVYLGHANQVRHAIAECIADCAAIDDALLFASDLISDTIEQMTSRGGLFTIRAEVHADYIFIETEDLHSPSRRRRSDGRPPGSAVLEALTGPSDWTVQTTSSGHRVICARLGQSTSE